MPAVLGSAVVVVVGSIPMLLVAAWLRSGRAFAARRPTLGVLAILLVGLALAVLALALLPFAISRSTLVFVAVVCGVGGWRMLEQQPERVLRDRGPQDDPAAH